VTRAHPPLIIAIDGPAGAGKSTAARRVAQRLHYLYLDTGAMYRAVALKALKEGISPADAAAMARVAAEAKIRLTTQDGEGQVWLDDTEVTQEIRSPAVTEAASRVSTHPAVREALVQQQRRCAADGGVVMEGRDIGTVVFPHADLKVFLSASPAERARRRATELNAQGVSVSLEVVSQQMAERDARDSEREASPLTRAADAVLLDTDHLTIDEVVEKILECCRQRGAAV
jgi:cytidylate kinase